MDISDFIQSCDEQGRTLTITKFDSDGIIVAYRQRPWGMNEQNWHSNVGIMPPVTDAR